MLLRTAPLTLAIKVTNAVFHVRVALEKYDKVAVLQSKSNMHVACWSLIFCQEM